jgi:hypothetical protein
MFHEAHKCPSFVWLNAQIDIKSAGPQLAQIARINGYRDSDNNGRQSAVWLAAHFNGRVVERPRQPK